jgi:methionyl-tRNA formyltransferase
MARILLIGMGSTAESAFDSLLERFELAGVVRQPDAHDPESDPIVRRARQSNVPIFPDISARGIHRAVTESAPDCVVVSSYNRLLNRDVIGLCPFVNVHYAPLPKYRGMAPLNWAILNGESSTAITVHTIVEGMDAGRILYQESVPIGGDDTVVDLCDRLNQIQRRQLGDAVARLLAGDTGVAQHEQDVTYGCNRMPQDGQIDWSASTRDVYALVRALVAPFPGAFTYLRGQRLIVWRATPVANPPAYAGRVPGRVVAVSKTEGSIDVLTGDGVMRLQQMQLEGGEPVTASTLVTSVRTTLGLSTSEMLARLQTLEHQVAELSRALKELTHTARV